VAIVDEVSATEVGRAFAALLGEDPVARRLWVRPHHGFVELWLLIAPSDVDTARRLHGTIFHLFDRYLDRVPRLFVLDPIEYPGSDPAENVPPDATEIPLRSHMEASTWKTS
jgi:hypothetical protein